MGTERIEIVLPAAIQEINATLKFSEFLHFYLFKRINMADLALEMDLSAMTVTDLKKALKVRGLTTTGVKQDLIERLHLALATDEADPNNDTDLLEDANELLGEDDDETPLVKPQTTAAKKVSIIRDNAETKPVPAAVSVEETPKKKEEEAQPASASEAATAGSSPPSAIKTGMSDAERAAARAARFGGGGDASSESKKQARAERFGIATNPSSSKIGAAP